MPRTGGLPTGSPPDQRIASRRRRGRKPPRPRPLGRCWVPEGLGRTGSKDTARDMGPDANPPRPLTRRLAAVRHWLRLAGTARSRSAAVLPYRLSLIHISEPTRRTPISYAVF